VNNALAVTKKERNIEKKERKKENTNFLVQKVTIIVWRVYAFSPCKIPKMFHHENE